jgi:hypothetical protein
VIKCPTLSQKTLFLIATHNSQRYWINRLHETLYPSIYYFWTVASLDVALMPEAHRAIEVVKTWSRDFLYNRPRWDARLLTAVYQTANICFYLDKADARRYIMVHPSSTCSTRFQAVAATSGGTIHRVPGLFMNLPVRCKAQTMCSFWSEYCS